MIRSTTKCDLDHIIDVGAGQGFRGRGLQMAGLNVDTTTTHRHLRLR